MLPAVSMPAAPPSPLPVNALVTFSQHYTLPSAIGRIRHVLHTRWGSVLAMAVLLTVLGLVLLTALRSPQKDDVAWLLYVARRWLAGQRLYEDLVEVNPPLIVWIYAVPAWISNAIGVEPKLIAVPFFAVLVLGAAWWSACLLHGRSALFTHRTPVFAVIGSILLALPGVEFGQREHLMTAALLPYLIVMACWLDGTRTRTTTSVLVGIVAGLGCALKPTYALAFLLPGLLGLLRGRKVLDTAPVSAFVAAMLYGIGVVLFCPAFLERAVPLALALYGGTDTPMMALLTQAQGLIFGVAVALVLWVTSRQRLAARGSFTFCLFAVLVTFAIGSTVVYVLQGKDWFYHRIPAIMATILALLLWGVEVLPRLSAPGLGLSRRRWIPSAILATLALGSFIQTSALRMAPWVEEAVEPNLSTEVRLEKIIKHEKARTYIAFSEWIGLGFPVVNNTGVIWTSRFDSMWALRGEMWRASQDGHAPADWPISHWVAKDFIAGCPDIAVVDARGGINYVSVLLTLDASFAQAWTHYRQIAMFNGLRVLKRQGPTCGPASNRPRIASTMLHAP